MEKDKKGNWKGRRTRYAYRKSGKERKEKEKEKVVISDEDDQCRPTTAVVCSSSDKDNRNGIDRSIDQGTVKQTSPRETAAGSDGGSFSPSFLTLWKEAAGAGSSEEARCWDMEGGRERGGRDKKDDDIGKRADEALREPADRLFGFVTELRGD